MPDQFVRGMLVAYYAHEGAIPEGWAICDGTNDTPDLRGKYLIGVDALGDVGRNVGNAEHRHSVAVNGGSTDGNRWGTPTLGDSTARTANRTAAGDRVGS